MARKGQFKKGGGRVGDHASMTHVKRTAAPARKAKKAHRATHPGHRFTSMARTPTREIIIEHSAPRKSRKSSRASGGGGISPLKIVLGAAVLANVTSEAGLLGKTPSEWIGKIPGSKTLGNAATAGLAMGAVWRFTKFGGKTLRPWLRLGGVVGLVAAGLKVGEAGVGFKWLGDVRDDMMDVVTD